jgi:hypothetical protein
VAFLAIHVNFEARCAVSDAQRNVSRFQTDPAKKNKCFCLVPYQFTRRRTAKRPSPPEVCCCFQDACFPGRVCSIDEIITAAKIELYVFQATKVVAFKAF